MNKRIVYKIYKYIILTWKSAWLDLKKAFWKYWFLYFVVSIMAYFITSFMNPDIKKLAQDLVGGSIEETNSNWKFTGFLFKNNLLVCFQILLLSFIPIRFLYTIPLITSSAVIGITLYLVQQVELNVLHIFGLGFLPHAIMELTTFILAAYYGNSINKNLIGRITNLLRKDKKVIPSLRQKINEAFIAFMLVITPCIFMAAFIEGFISRFLLNTF